MKILKSTVHPTDVSDEDIDKEINTLRDQRASFDVVDREAEEVTTLNAATRAKWMVKPVAEILPDKRVR